MSVDMPKPFAALCQMEVRRLWRSPLAWAFLLVPPAIFALVGRWQAPAIERHLDMLAYTSLLGLGYSALAAWTAQRDRRTGSDEVILAWPVASWRLYLARTLALGSLTGVLWLEAALPSLVYTALSYATAAGAAGLPIPLGAALRDGGLIALSLAASLLGAQALGQVLGALLPGLAAFVALVLCGAFAMVGQRLVLGILQWPYALLTSPQFLWEGWPRLADGLRAGLYTDLFVTHQGFWVLGSVAALAALTFRFQARRDAPHARTLLAGAALLAAVAAAVPFVAVEGRYVAAQARAIAAYGEATKAPYRLSDGLPSFQSTESPALPTPVRYSLRVDATRPPEVGIEAALELVAGADVAGDALVFTLRRAFEVQEVRLDGAPVPFERERDLLRIRPPQAIPAGRAFTVAASYHGRVEDWRLDAYETPAALASPAFIYLPAGWGWYPVPGEQRLTWEIGMTSMVFRALADRTAPFNSAEPAFDVRVQAPEEVRCLAGLAKGAEGVWRLQEDRNQLTLLGGPWYEQVAGPVRFALPFEELDTWQTSMADVQRLLAALADWTGVEPLTMVPSPLPLVHSGDASLLTDSSFRSDALPAAPEREWLSWGARRWFSDLLRYQPRIVVSGSDAARYAPGDELDTLRAYVMDRVMEDAFGTAPEVEVRRDPGADTMPRVEAWLARTPREAQKAALRRLFHDAQLRPLAPEDLAFLDDGAAQ